MAISKKQEPLDTTPNTEFKSGEMVIRKAERKQAKIRIGVCGPAGTGKTFSSLLIASGLGKKILLVDTENGSGDLYAGVVDYDVLPLNAPYTVEKYIKAMEIAEEQGYDVVILDSISHCWAGSGGLLEQQNFAAKRTGNSYTAWATITPLHTKFVEKMLTINAHLIATVRQKPEYVMDKGADGRTTIRKVGLAPIQKEGLEHEFGIVFDLDQEHNAFTTKDRTGLFDGKTIKLSGETGETITMWLSNAA